jgi:cytochrome P450
MRSQKTERLSDDQASHLCGILLEAGSDTSAVELRSFVKAMVLSPEPQRKAQEELDQVCGDRMPEIGDAEALPYIRACVKEVCRWGPAVLMGIPHSLVRDDSYMGYKIPAGAMVLMNVWSVHMDAKRHHNPRKYDPSRYLNNCDKSARRSALSPNPEDRDHYLFGAGRRMCPGMDLADNSLFLALARILWAFSISPALDDRGKEILPDADDIIAGLPAHPAPFKAVIRPRSEKRAQEVGRQWSQAQAEFLDDDSQWKQDPIQRQGSC